MTTDGDYTLYFGHDPAKPWTSYCYGMSGTDAGAAGDDAGAAGDDAGDAGDTGGGGPIEYLPVAAATNYSQYTAGGLALVRT